MTVSEDARDEAIEVHSSPTQRQTTQTTTLWEPPAQGSPFSVRQNNKQLLI